jgi:hypothetical protein
MSDTPVQDTDVQVSEEKPPMEEALYSSEETTAAPEATTAPASGAEDPSPPAAEVEAETTPPVVEAKAPEGAAVNSEFLESVTKEAQEKGWDQATVDRIVEMNVAEMDGYDAASKLHWENELAKFDKECAADPDLKDYDNVVAPLFEKYGNADDLKLLKEAGVLQIPALKRMLARAGKDMAEDRVNGALQGATNTTAPALADVLYDHKTSRGTG